MSDRGNLFSVRTSSMCGLNFPTPSRKRRLSDWAANIREHGPMAFQTASRILGHLQDTEDAVQEAFLEAFRRHCKGKIRNFPGFIRTAVTCRSLDRLRQRRPVTELSERLVSPLHQRPDQIAERMELAEWLRNAVARLPARQAEIFSLRYFAELSNSEIAEALQISSDAVAVALHKARTNIAKERADVETFRGNGK